MVPSAIKTLALPRSIWLRGGQGQEHCATARRLKMALHNVRMGGRIEITFNFPRSSSLAALTVAAWRSEHISFRGSTGSRGQLPRPSLYPPCSALRALRVHARPFL